MQKKIVLALFIVIFAGYIGLILWTRRALFLSQFNPTYWKDRYDHSQWQIPNSPRVLGDDGLYLYEGYRLIHGADPTQYSAEVPPLGKYLIGASITFFGNGYWYALITTTLALVSLFVLTTMLLGHPWMSALTTLAMALDPLLVSQFSVTMMDSLQLALLATTLVLFISSLRAKRLRLAWMLAAGVSFGLFSEAKFALSSAPLTLIFLFMIWKNPKPLRSSACFLASAVIGYLLPYAAYFAQGKSLAAWISAQKYLVTFYLRGAGPTNTGSVFTALLFARIQNIFSRIWEAAPYWSISWPVIFIGSIVALRALVKRPNIAPATLLIALIAGMYAAILTIIPFWPRYLLILLPFLYILFVLWIQTNHRKLLGGAIGLLIVSNAAGVIPVLFPTPESTVKQFVYDWKQGLFADMYQSLGAHATALSEADFARFGQQIFYDAQIESATITTQNAAWSSWHTSQSIPITITYVTRALGTFTQQSNLPLVKEQGQWKVLWSWILLIDGLTQHASAQTAVIPARRGSILAKDGTPLAEDRESYLISILPSAIDRSKEDEMNRLIETLLERRIAAVSIHSRYVTKALPDRPVPIGVIQRSLSPSELTALKSYPGVVLTPALGRFADIGAYPEIGHVANTQFRECCSVLYNTTSYDGIDGLEKQFNATLKGHNGGELILFDSRGEPIRTVISKDKKDGQSVQL